MFSLHELATRDDRPTGDQFVHFYGVSWEAYEQVMAMRGDKSAPRIAYLKGTLEIMSPSREHEAIKSVLGRLVETFCDVEDIEFGVYGSWTLKNRREERGAEPDECYIFGTRERDRPDLAIEVEWTSGGLDKLRIYRKLGVREVWYWRKGQLRAFGLGDDGYEALDGSVVLPGIDLDQLASFVDRPRTSQAIRDYRAALLGASG